MVSSVMPVSAAASATTYWDSCSFNRVYERGYRNSFILVRPLERRIGTGAVQHGSAPLGIPYVELVVGVFGHLFEIALTQQHASVLAHQEGRRSAFFNEFDILQIVLNDVVRHGQSKIAVGCGLDGIVLVRFHGGGRLHRIDGDNARTLLLGALHPSPVLRRAMHGIRAPDHNMRGIEYTLCLVSEIHKAGAEHAIDAVASGKVVHARRLRDPHDTTQAIEDTRLALNLAIVARPKVEDYGLGSILFSDAGELLSDFSNGLVPRDALPLASATLGTIDPAQRILDAVFSVNAMHVRHAAQTAAAIKILAIIGRLQPNDLTVAHMGSVATGLHAVRTADAIASNFILCRLSGIRGIEGATNQIRSDNGSTSSCTRGFKEASASQTALRAIPIRHLSSSCE